MAICSRRPGSFGGVGPNFVTILAIVTPAAWVRSRFKRHAPDGAQRQRSARAGAERGFRTMGAVRQSMWVSGALVAAACVGTLLTAGPASAQAVRGWGSKNREQATKAKQYVPAAKAQEKMFPLDSTWTAVSVNGKTFPSTERPSFIIDKQYRARGFGGCNTFVATAFPLKEQHLAVGPLALTKKPCENGLSASEKNFLMAFRTSGAWDIVGSQLVIKSQAGEIKFERAL